MNIVPFNRTLRNTPDIFERLFSDVFSGLDRYDARPWQPPLDVSESDDGFVINVELPGVSKEDLNINLENGIMTLSGEKKKSSADTRRIERVYGTFTRSFSIPESADKEKIAARFEQGVLTISVPKLPIVKPQKIIIE